MVCWVLHERIVCFVCLFPAYLQQAPGSEFPSKAILLCCACAHLLDADTAVCGLCSEECLWKPIPIKFRLDR